MRRLFILVAASAFLVACEDGPTQTYSGAPNGAGGLWNDGKNPGGSDTANQGYGGDVGGQNVAEICNAPKRKMVWSSLFNADIVPPLGLINTADPMGPSINMAGDDTWVGLAVQDAEKANCQSSSLGDIFGDGDLTNAWGDNDEIVFEYRVSNRKIFHLFLEQGFTGHAKFHSPDGKDQFDISVTNQVLKNSKPYTLTWDFANKAVMAPWATELTNALFATYAGLPQEPDCTATGHCVLGHFGDQGYMYIPALGFAIRVSSITAAQPVPSTVAVVDQYLAKNLPYSLANPRLALDSLGPEGIASGLGPTGAITCDLHMGITYADLLKDCVQVTGDMTTDTQSLNKLLGGLTHGTERFHFDIQGVDINFTDKSLPPTDIIHDTDKPSPTDVGTQFVVDQSTLGRLVNDYTGNDPTAAKDIHGTALVYTEFARLSQAKLNAWLVANGRTPHNLGDPACIPNPITHKFADGCTGLEGFIIPANAADPAYALYANNAHSLTSGFPGISVLKAGLKPGHQNVIICDDPSDWTTCSAGDTFPTIYARLLSVLGQGKVSKLPPFAQDARFFWQQWATAFVKYQLVSTKTDAGVTPAVVQAVTVNENDIFFDSIGSGQFEIAEYVNRTTAVADPMNAFENKEDITDLEIEADVKNGIFDAYVFSRDVLRGETALYSAARTDSSLPVGSESNALLSNLFGSPLLSGSYSAVTNSAGTVVATAYQCATDPNNIDCATHGQVPPLDAFGNPELNSLGQPLLSDYPFAFMTGSDFTLGVSPSPVTVKQTFNDIQQAQVHVPIHKNPGDYNSALDPAHKTDVDLLVPWAPKQPGIGFPVAISGTRDKFIETSQLDFSGTTLTANVDYDLVDPHDATKGTIFLAVESTDYLGEVFLCYDSPSSGGDGTMLHARMYTPVAALLDWISKHKSASDACGMIVRWSPYNNFPDYITSLAYGVRLGITQGGGYGRVVDTVLFVPGQ